VASVRGYLDLVCRSESGLAVNRMRPAGPVQSQAVCVGFAASCGGGSVGQSISAVTN
jgi:hypothetical protein